MSPDFNQGIGHPDSPHLDLPQGICDFSDMAVVSCAHCRENGTFDPRQFVWQHRPEPEAMVFPAEKTEIRDERSEFEQLCDKVFGPAKDPVTEGFQRNRFGHGRKLF